MVNFSLLFHENKFSNDNQKEILKVIEDPRVQDQRLIKLY